MKMNQSSNPTSSSLTMFAGIGLSVVDETIDGIRKSGGVADEPPAAPST